MSDNDYILQTRQQMLRSYILGRMLAGAGYAAAILVGIFLFLWVLATLGKLLPEESRQTPDPMPRSSIEFPLETDRSIA